MRQVELVIFDCDGILVDSEPIIIDVLADLLNEFGVPVTAADIYDRLHGRSTTQWVTQIEDLLGGSLPKTFLATLKQRAAIALWTDITPILRITDALSSIHVPICVASSGDYEKVQLTLGRTGLLSRFGTNIFTVSDVKRPKPYPDIYLHAARENEIDPSNCAVIEDSPIGVRAGVAAGMTVFGYSAHTSEHQLRDAGAHILFSDMRHLPNLLTSFEGIDKVNLLHLEAT